MVLLFGAIGLGVLDYNLIWVNPTYLWPGIVGGLIMGVGFIVGGFCPGTSLVSAATFKIDGLFFVLGGLAGIFLFGETVDLFWDWWNNSYYGRLTLMDVFSLPAGVIVVGVILMALFMFWGGEQLERIIGKRDLSKEPRLRWVGAAALLLVAIAVMLIGTPDTADKWARLAPEKEPALEERQVQIHPGELLESIADDRLRVVMLDVRPESDYNLFHIQGAENVSLDDLPAMTKEMLAETYPNTVYVVMSNDEDTATQAWKILVAESVPNVYILEGGVNNWLRTFAADESEIVPKPASVGQDRLGFLFLAALGDRYEAAFPNLHDWEMEFIPKIKLEMRRDKSGGGCG
jgi:rhodanese-related sulfurtransferase